MFTPVILAGGNGSRLWPLSRQSFPKQFLALDGQDQGTMFQRTLARLQGLEHASALAAITNPTVNSYKRINAPRTISGSTWAPNSVTWTGDNRTHMVRVLPGRIEHRLPDGAANPYLTHAVILAAGLDGIRRKLDPGSRSDIDMTKQIAAAARTLDIDIHDHLIVGRKDVASFRQKGLM